MRRVSTLLSSYAKKKAVSNSSGSSAPLSTFRASRASWLPPCPGTHNSSKPRSSSLASLAGSWRCGTPQTTQRPRYRPPPPSLLRKPEKEATDATIRAIALAARAMSEADVTITARVDRGPCLLEFGGRRATKAAILAQATSAAYMAMQQFVRDHYTQSLPLAHVRTALPSVSHRWIDEPAKQHAEQFRLRARVRLGISASPTSTPIASRAAPMAAATAHTAASWRPLQTCSRGATSSSATTAEDTATRQKPPSRE